jgi:hypothetical protein
MTCGLLVNTQVDIAATNSLSWLCCQNKFRHVISITKCEGRPTYVLLCCTRRQSGANATRWKHLTAVGYKTAGEEWRGEGRRQKCVPSGEFDNPQSYTGQVPSNCDCEVPLAVYVRAKSRLCWFVRHRRSSRLFGVSTPQFLSPAPIEHAITQTGYTATLKYHKLRPTE